ncbi:MAG: hypothetical protein FWD47_10690 [Treponema sp.]|nr:hypothetical protein [Treponema sp.]
MESLKEFIIEYNIILVIAAWVFSFGIGCIVVFVWKKAMDTVQPQTHACSYIVSGSLNFREKKDRFLYSTVNKVRRQKR